MPPKSAVRQRRAPAKSTVTTAAKRHLTGTASKAPPVARASRKRKDITAEASPEWIKTILKKKAPAKGKRKAPAASPKNSKAAPAAKRTSQKRKTQKSKVKKEDEGDEETSESDASLGMADSSDNSEASSGSPTRRRSSGRKSTGSNEGRRPTKAQRVCLRCKLDKEEWPFCGVSGEEHVIVVEKKAEKAELKMEA